MLDIDQFKGFNDTYGHDAGDAVLCELGRVLRENLRKSDISCRSSPTELLRSADESLYVAKHSGGDCIVAHSPTTSIPLALVPSRGSA